MISALLKSDSIGTCLMVQWLRPTTRGTGLTSGQRTEIVHAAQSKKKKKVPDSMELPHTSYHMRIE